MSKVREIQCLTLIFCLIILMFKLDGTVVIVKKFMLQHIILQSNLSFGNQ